MTDPIDYGGSWKKRRWNWKELIAGCPALSRGAKHFAAHLCDSFANSKTACVWARNDTLAAHFALSVRTVQRHLSELGSAYFIR